MSNLSVQSFIINNIGVIIALMVAVLGLIQAIISKDKQKIYSNIYGIVSDAEQIVGAVGVDKFNFAFNAAYGKLPKLLKLFICEDDIKRAIEYSLNKLQSFADQQAKAQSMQVISNNTVNNTNIQNPAEIASETAKNNDPASGSATVTPQ